MTSRVLQPRLYHENSKMTSLKYSTSLVFRRFYSVPLMKSLGIRREGKNRWERRVSLVPKHVEKLTKQGIKVFVQPSTKRIFGDEKYSNCGAIVTEDLSHVDVIVGVKEVGIDELIPDKTYCFFSHTHKGQPYNMSMLKNILDKKITLIDYELMTDEKGKRLVLFGTFAGYAGMIDCLHGLGQRLLALGYGTPFLHIGMTHQYRSLFDARAALRMVGLHLEHEGLPKKFGPLIFGFTGSGHVSHGSQDVFKDLPHEMISVKDLKDLCNGDYDSRKVYGIEITMKDYARRISDNGFDSMEFRSKPELYKSIFATDIAPYLSVLINGIYWDKRFPRLLTRQDLINLPKLISIADISCDLGGSIEFMDRASTIDHPFFYYDPYTNSYHSNVEKRGVQICSIDNLPTELPLEASEYFSNALYPHLESLLLNEPSNVIDGATIVKRGKLESRHEKLGELVENVVVERKDFKVLVLGSGMVVSPVISHLSSNYDITIATDSLPSAQHLKNDRVNIIELNVKDEEKLVKVIKNHDIIVSLVPANLHPRITELSIIQGKNVVTASYRSPQMYSLDSLAKKNNVTIMNEIGLDPGLDHLSAQKIIDEARNLNGRVFSFQSLCGGLPCPEYSNNPLGYKFSWSPKSSLLALNNPAKYLKNGQIIEIEGNDLLNHVEKIELWKGFNLEHYPNRNSMDYIPLYSLDNLETMYRGTLRYGGFGNVMQGLKKLGLLSSSIPSQGTWDEWLKSINLQDVDDDLRNVLKWLDLKGSFSNDFLLDSFSSILSCKLSYDHDERDLVLLHHSFGIELDDGHREKWTSSLVRYGNTTTSAMSWTVGIPIAITVELLLKKKIMEKGSLIPNKYHELYLPLLQQQGIQFIETKTSW